MADAVSILEQLIRGLSMVSDVITQGVKYVLSYIGLNLPDYAITLGTIIFIILLLWKFGSAINKIILIALIFLLLSSLAGLAAPLLGR
jgi:cbb3-type cytochrome oxidase subunit 1